MDGKKRKSHQQSAACTAKKKPKSEIRLKMMSDADKDLLNLKRVTLMEGIDLTSSTLLDELRARRVITVHQKQVLKTESGDINQVGALLDHLLRGDEDTLDNFIYALRKSGHAALAETTLRSPRKADKFADTPVPDKEKDILRKHQSTLSAKMTSLIVVVNGLHGRKVLSDNDKEEIMAIATAYGKNSALVTCLMKKAMKGLPAFVDLLKETDQTELAELLTRDDEDVKEDLAVVEEEGNEDAVVVAYNGEEYEVDVEKDGTLLASTINSQLGPGHTAKGLKYTNQATGRSRAVRLCEGKFFPPQKGWGKLVYDVVPDFEDVKEEVVEEEGNEVVVAYNGEEYEVDVEEDGTLLASTINSQLEPGHTAKGLKYTNQDTGRSRAVRLCEGKFFPPKTGWGKLVYDVVPGTDEQNGSTSEPSSTDFKC